MTSVCTGSLVYAAAGLLVGRRATTHWASLNLLSEIDPTVITDVDARFVDDGDLITSAGVSAGIDMALHLVAPRRQRTSPRGAPGNPVRASGGDLRAPALRTASHNAAASHGAQMSALLENQESPAMTRTRITPNRAVMAQDREPTMHAVFQDRYGTADVLSVARMRQPPITNDRVLVKVHAAGLDRGTEHLMTGKPYAMRLAFGLRRPKNPIPGRDVARHCRGGRCVRHPVCDRR